MRLRNLFRCLAAVLGGSLLITASFGEESSSIDVATNTPPALQTTLRNEEMIGSSPVRRAYIYLGTNAFAFVVPDGYRLDTTNPQRVSLIRQDNQCFLTFQIAGFGFGSAAKSESNLFRERALDCYPQAKILEEFSKTIANRQGPAFDLQWTNSFGGPQAARVIFIPSEAGTLEFTAQSNRNEFEEAASALHFLSLTFRSNEGGTLNISRLSDRI